MARLEKQNGLSLGHSTCPEEVFVEASPGPEDMDSLEEAGVPRALYEELLRSYQQQQEEMRHLQQELERTRRQLVQQAKKLKEYGALVSETKELRDLNRRLQDVLLLRLGSGECSRRGPPAPPHRADGAHRAPPGRAAGRGRPSVPEVREGQSYPKGEPLPSRSEPDRSLGVQQPWLSRAQRAASGNGAQRTRAGSVFATTHLCIHVARGRTRGTRKPLQGGFRIVKRARQHPGKCLTLSQKVISATGEMWIRWQESSKDGARLFVTEGDFGKGVGLEGWAGFQGTRGSRGQQSHWGVKKRDCNCSLRTGD